MSLPTPTPIPARTTITTIDQYMADLDLFRVAFPLPPLPFPLEIVASSGVEDNSPSFSKSLLAAALPHVTDVLALYSIIQLQISVEHQRRFVGNGSRPTLLSLVSQEDCQHFRSAARDIHGLLEQRGWSNIQVELLEPTRFFWKHIGSSSPSSEAVAAFELVKIRSKTRFWLWGNSVSVSACIYKINRRPQSLWSGYKTAPPMIGPSFRRHAT